MNSPSEDGLPEGLVQVLQNRIAAVITDGLVQLLKDDYDNVKDELIIRIFKTNNPDVLIYAVKNKDENNVMLSYIIEWKRFTPKHTMMRMTRANIQIL